MFTQFHFINPPASPSSTPRDFGLSLSSSAFSQIPSKHADVIKDTSLTPSSTPRDFGLSLSSSAFSQIPSKHADVIKDTSLTRDMELKFRELNVILLHVLFQHNH